MPLELLKSRTGRTLIESHRGMEGDMPENSWSAVEQGHKLGADLLEVDIQLSADGVAFLRHDYTLPDGRWCKDVSWKELKELRIGDQPLPLLEDILVWARDAGAHLSLDVKTFFRTEGSLAREVIRLLDRTNTKENVLLLFFDHQELVHTKLAYPELAVRALVTGRLSDFASYLEQIRADCISVSYGILRPEDIAQFHSIGVAVVLVEYWNQNNEFFEHYEVDVLSCANPLEAKRILKIQ